MLIWFACKLNTKTTVNLTCSKVIKCHILETQGDGSKLVKF